MSQANRQLIQDLYDAFGRGDAGAVLAAFHPEIRWLEAEHVGYDDRNPYRGPQQVGEGVFGSDHERVGRFPREPATAGGGG